MINEPHGGYIGLPTIDEWVSEAAYNITPARLTRRTTIPTSTLASTPRLCSRSRWAVATQRPFPSTSAPSRTRRAYRTASWRTRAA